MDRRRSKVFKVALASTISVQSGFPCLFLCPTERFPLRFREVAPSRQHTQSAIVRAAWAAAAPAKKDYGLVVSDLNSSKLVGEGDVFERGAHVPVTHVGYFEPRKTLSWPILSHRTDGLLGNGNISMQLESGWN